MTTASKGRKSNKSEQPTCSQCSEPMKLARTAPFKGYADIQDRTYECQKCGHSESWIVSISPKPTAAKVLTIRLRTGASVGYCPNSEPFVLI